MYDQPLGDDSSASNKTFAELAGLVVDGKLTEKDSRLLEELLSGNVELQHAFVDLLLLHDLLDEWLGTEGLIGMVDMLTSESGILPSFVQQRLALHGQPTDIVASTDESSSPPSAVSNKSVTTKRFDRPTHWVLAIAVCLAVAGLLQWLIPSNQSGSPTTTRSDNSQIADSAKNAGLEDSAVATLQQGYQVQFSERTRPKNWKFVAGSYELEGGIIGLVFKNGAKLVIQAPAEFAIVDDMTVRLDRGRARAHVPEPAIGFTIVTPEFEVEDLGTEFGVSVLDDQGANVRVFAGKVRLLDGGEFVKELSVGGVAGRRLGDWQQALDHRESSFLTPADVGYRRWLEHKSKVMRDANLAFYFDFEKAQRQQKYIYSTAGTLNTTRAEVFGGTVVQGRWPGTRAMLFEEFDDHISLDIAGEYEAFTITTWLQLHSLSWPYQTILNTNEWPQSTHHLNVMRDGTLNGGLRCDLAEGFENHRLSSAAGVVGVGNWTHIATVVDVRAGQIRHFVNGVEVSAAKLKFPESHLRFGASSIGNWGFTPKFAPGGPLFYNRPLCGRIDEIALYGRPLTAAEISSHYDAGNGFN